MKKETLPKKFVKALEEEGWSLLGVYKQDDKYYAEIENWSPAGENLVETIWYDGTPDGFVEGARELYESYDADEHAEMWVESRGKNGAPRSIRTLIDDADAIEKMFEALAQKIASAQEGGEGK